MVNVNLIGGYNLTDAERVRQFETMAEAKAFADAENEDFIQEWGDVEAYYNNPNSPAWVVEGRFE